MSDMPMRLKYLTKMKIILCIFLLYITAVSVFGRSVELDSVVGGSVKFPAAVKIEGNLRYSGEVAPIGVVTSGRFTTPRDGRLQWDSSTGLFYLSELRVQDSGIYTVQDTQQTPVSTFNLTVWEDNVPVSKPHLNVTRNEYPCTVLCAAARGTGATLTLYKNGETNPYVTSPGHSHPDLDLPVPVESGTYTCEAKNSVSRETSDPLTVGADCTAPSSPSPGTIVAIIFAVVAVLIAGFLAVLYCREKRLAVIRDAVRSLILVKQVLDNIVALAPDEDKQAFIHDAFTRLILVEEMQALRSNVIKLLDILGAPASVWDLISCPNALKTKTSSHPTEVPLNQATPEVEE